MVSISDASERAHRSIASSICHLVPDLLRQHSGFDRNVLAEVRRPRKVTVGSAAGGDGWFCRGTGFS